MIDKAVAIHKEFGSVSNEDYLRICGEHGYGGTDPERYMWKLKATVETVLKTLA